MRIIIGIVIACFAMTVVADEKVKLILDWFPNPNHAPIFVAQQQGFFKDEGLDIDIIGPADPSDPPKLVAAKQADIAISYQPHLLLQQEQHLPLVRIATLIDKPLNCLTVNADSDIKNITDLKGKKIGYSMGGTDSAMLKVMLAKNGVQLSDVELINVHYNLTQALMSRKVDATIGMARNFEITQMALMHRLARTFFPENYGVPSYDELLFVVNRDSIHDKRFAAFAKALQRGVDYLLQHPEQTWQTFAKEHPELNNELNRRAWFDTLKYFAHHPAQLDKNRYQKFAQFMFDNGLIKKIPNVDDYAIDVIKE